MATPATLTTLAAAQDPWLGQPVFTKDSARLRVGTTAVDREKIPFPATVGKVNGDWLWLGRAWVKTSDVRRTDEALAYYTEEIRRNPTSADGWVGRGAVWNTKGEIDNAIKDYTEAIRLDPAPARAYNSIAWLRATCPDEQFRDGAEAVVLATKACELSAWTAAGGSRHARRRLRRGGGF